jgi:hypothetical protein
MKKGIIGLVLLLAVASLMTWRHWAGSSKPSISVATTSISTLVPMQMPIAEPNNQTVARTPAYEKTLPNLTTLRPTLSPGAFTGNVRLAYQAAQEIPQTLAQLPCYCHCDRAHGHASLHSCFESEHGQNCGICIGEAVMAYNLEKRAKLNVGQIRERIIAAYGPQSDSGSR